MRGQVFQWVMCSEERLDAHRFRDTILAAIAEGRAKPYRAFKPWSARVAATPAPKDPLAKRQGKKARSSAAGGDQQLVAQIRLLQHRLLLALPGSFSCVASIAVHAYASAVA
jgi:DnaJ family protein C protein 9